MSQKSCGLLIFSRGRHYVIDPGLVLFFFFAQHSSLLEILTPNTVASTWYGFESILGQRLTSLHTLPVTGCFNSLESFVN